MHLRLAVSMTAPIIALVLGSSSPQASPDVQWSHRAFDQLTSLVGQWRTPYDFGDHAKASYRLVSGGFALLETFENVGPMKLDMISVYDRDDPNLMMTHFCVLGNQVRLHAKEVDSPNRITFEFDDVTNSKQFGSAHITKLVIEFVDNNHFNQEWTWVTLDGKVDTVRYRYQRIE